MNIKKHTIPLGCTLLLVLTSLSTLQAYPPSNAAVLYYRAFLVMKEPCKEVGDMVSSIRQGKILSNDAINQSLKENSHVFELVETAVTIEQCDWGRDDSKGFDLLLPELAKIRQISYLFCAEAHSQAKNGDFHAALEKCLTIHRMARHVGNDLIISFLINTSLNDIANEHIQAFLSKMPENLDTLTWLKSEMTDIATNALTIKRAIQREKEIAIHEIRQEKVDTILEAVGQDATGNPISTQAIARIRQGDETFFADSRDYYSRVMTDVIVALDLPYGESHKTLKAINSRVQKDAQKDTSAILTAILVPALTRIGSGNTKKMTRFNALIAAIDVYLVKVRTGQLPDTLPTGTPHDLFSSKPFAYSKTKQGFVLRCQVKDADRDKTYQFAF